MKMMMTTLNGERASNSFTRQQQTYGQQPGGRMDGIVVRQHREFTLGTTDWEHVMLLKRNYGDDI